MNAAKFLAWKHVSSQVMMCREFSSHIFVTKGIMNLNRYTAFCVSTSTKTEICEKRYSDGKTSCQLANYIFSAATLSLSPLTSIQKLWWEKFGSV